MAMILFIEDNPSILDINRTALQMRAYEVLCAKTLKEGERLLSLHQVDCIVLDVMLPDGSGLTWCKDIKREYSTPILFLSALGESKDIIAGLQAGGDDYLAKPYDLNVLVARIEARLRANSATPRFVRFGALKLDTLSLTGYLNEEDMFLTQKEFALLHLLIKHQGYVVEKETIVAHLWGDSAPQDASMLYSLLSRLKRKLQSNKTGIAILSKRPVGYCIERL